MESTISTMTASTTTTTTTTPTGLTNVYINHIMHLFDNNFIGVFSADKIPDIYLKHRQSLIINLSKSKERGSHFIAFKKINNDLLYFDSLCTFILPLEVRDFISNQKDINLIYNKKPIQHIESTYCGYYCIGFILYMNYMTLTDFLVKFYINVNHLLKNDIIILELIKKYISEM